MTTTSLKYVTKRLGVAVLTLGLAVLVGCGDDEDAPKPPPDTPEPVVQKPLDHDEATAELAKLLGSVSSTEVPVDRRVKLDLTGTSDLKETLPEITEFDLAVDPQVATGDIVVEIFASTEKSGSGTDGWLVEVARAFNESNAKVQSGKTAKVRIREIASGVGYQFIAANRYRPHGYTPSNHLWVRMVEAHGVKMSPVRERLVGNLAGIVMRTQAAKQLEQTYQSVAVDVLIDAVVQGQLVMGYTNPYASSTGLNFLVTVLATFGGGDETKMLSDEVVTAFESFQRGVPFVALTTLQMRDSVTGDGSLDAFVMEYQTYVKTQALQSGYEFIPFGIRHDNPLYAVGDPGPEVLEVLELLAAFAEQKKFAELASSYGFNASIQYNPSFDVPSGALLVEAQTLWKEKKDAGRPISAVFLVDVSGSMDGTKLKGAKKALEQGADFITTTNSIGLVLFSHNVTVVLSVQRFNLNHKASFLAAVEDMNASGGTAMYDGVLVALNLLIEEKKKNPDIKPMLFVLTDGETQDGFKYDEVEAVVRGVGIPVYTMGYEADLQELGRLSSLVEAASLNADEGEISYKIGSLLNAQM